MSAIIATRWQIHPELAAARDHDAGQIQCEVRALRDHRDVGIVFLRNLPLWVVAVVVTWLTRALVVNLGPFAHNCSSARQSVLLPVLSLFAVLIRSDRSQFICCRLCEN